MKNADNFVALVNIKKLSLVLKRAMNVVALYGQRP